MNLIFYNLDPYETIFFKITRKEKIYHHFFILGREEIIGFPFAFGISLYHSTNLLHRSIQAAPEIFLDICLSKIIFKI